jgi:hypothetical protein
VGLFVLVRAGLHIVCLGLLRVRALTGSHGERGGFCCVSGLACPGLPELQVIGSFLGNVLLVFHLGVPFLYVDNP